MSNWKKQVRLGVKTFCATAKDNTLYHLLKMVERLSISFGGGIIFNYLLCKKCPNAYLVSLPEIQIKGIHSHWEGGVCTRDGESVCNL